MLNVATTNLWVCDAARGSLHAEVVALLAPEVDQRNLLMTTTKSVIGHSQQQNWTGQNGAEDHFMYRYIDST